MISNVLISTIANISVCSTKMGIIMFISNIITIIIGRYSIKVRGLGASILITSINGFGLPELLATTSLGHIIGTGIILGVSSINTAPIF
uniref:Photosystem I reaction center subunit PsaK n=1 Tax=Boldia erythrosiphon TaxID=74908 RepID=A0A1Y9TLZ6_9RHOD|nr:photosystem I reaction center subunit X [Boldia erythrosiphon]ARO90661.1 photosystem I reaction center subunit X [Boldia erythrosiphon]